jgi:hypothetical protein
MNKIFLSIIIFLIGLVSGYCFIILAGYSSSWATDLLIISGKILKKYEMLYMLGTVIKIQSFITSVLAAIPVFLISGLLLIYFIKNNTINIKSIKWISSIGLIIFPVLASGIPSLSNGWYFEALMILIIPLLMNLFYINKISSIINAPNKNEETQ